MTQRGAKGDASAENVMINPADAPFWREQAAVVCFACQAYLVTCAFLHPHVPWWGGVGVCTVPKHLNEKNAIVGHSLL